MKVYWWCVRWGGGGGWVGYDVICTSCLVVSGIVPKTVDLLPNVFHAIEFKHLSIFYMQMLWIWFLSRTPILSDICTILTCSLRTLLKACIFIHVKICLVHVHVTNFCCIYWVYTVVDPVFFFLLLFYSKWGGAIIKPKHSPGLILNSSYLKHTLRQ